MKIIECMRTLKLIDVKIGELQQRIAANCANHSHETLPYGDETSAKVTGWLQSCEDLTQEAAALLLRLQRTNLATQVPIKIGEKTVTKSIAEWVLRRRKFAAIDQATWEKLTDRGLRDGLLPQSTGTPLEVKVRRHYDSARRDEKVLLYKQEPHLIDGALEVANATTDLLD